MEETALDRLGLPDPADSKSGAAPVEIGLTDWSRGFPGVARVSWHGEEWRALDYGDKLPLGPELCERFFQAGRHSGNSTVSAEVRRRGCASRPRRTPTCSWTGPERSPDFAHISLVSATEAAVALGDCPPWISPEENDSRVFTHDVIEADHEKDFHSLAAFPHESRGDLALYVWRVSRGRALTLESFVGADF